MQKYFQRNTAFQVNNNLVNVLHAFFFLAFYQTLGLVTSVNTYFHFQNGNKKKQPVEGYMWI